MLITIIIITIIIILITIVIIILIMMREKENNIVSNNKFICRSNDNDLESNVFEEINECNLIGNYILSNPVIHSPPIGFG